jgi:CHASE3 domain sensor protein
MADKANTVLIVIVVLALAVVAGAGVYYYKKVQEPIKVVGKAEKIIADVDDFWSQVKKAWSDGRS